MVELSYSINLVDQPISDVEFDSVWDWMQKMRSHFMSAFCYCNCLSLLVSIEKCIRLTHCCFQDLLALYIYYFTTGFWDNQLQVVIFV